MSDYEATNECVDLPLFRSRIERNEVSDLEGMEDDFIEALQPPGSQHSIADLGPASMT